MTESLTECILACYVSYTGLKLHTQNTTRKRSYLSYLKILHCRVLPFLNIDNLRHPTFFLKHQVYITRLVIFFVHVIVNTNFYCTKFVLVISMKWKWNLIILWLYCVNQHQTTSLTIPKRPKSNGCLLSHFKL